MPSRAQTTTSTAVSSARLTRRAITVWLGAVAIYLVAVTGRTSFGVAGVEAMDRFHIDASRVAVFAAVQIGAYAASQIPVGIIVDRLGPKKVLLAGAVIMAIGQVILGLTHNYPLAVAARFAVGAGDATAWISVMRILPLWLPLKQAPFFTQATSSLGQFGQLMSAIPFAALLHWSGWTHAFVSLGVAGLIVAVACSVVVQDSPNVAKKNADVANADEQRPRPSSTGARLKLLVRSPFCWQGFFTHWTLVFMAWFTLMWGVPMMRLGMGLTDKQASTVLIINMISSVTMGPVVGYLSARLGARRGNLVLAATLINAGLFAWFFASATPRGFLAIAVVNGILAATTMTCNFGFDTVRENLAHENLGAATGFVNIGGFCAGMIATQLFGLVLDHVTHTSTYVWQDFRLAFPTVAGVWLVGTCAFLFFRHRARKIRKAQPRKVDVSPR